MPAGSAFLRPIPHIPIEIPVATGEPDPVLAQPAADGGIVPAAEVVLKPGVGVRDVLRDSFPGAIGRGGPLNVVTGCAGRTAPGGCDHQSRTETARRVSH